MLILLNVFPKCKVKLNHRSTSFSFFSLDNEDEDEDTNVVDQVVSNKCPLTQKPFNEAVQNKKCKHKYEKQTVLKYIADKNKSKRPAKCPSAGCENILNEKDLINA
jgi:SUMO ligase MMS21 Smc5/6 complex component